MNLLTSKSILFEDFVFDSPDDVEEFKRKHAVETTPQIFRGEERIGGYSDLAASLGEEAATDEKSYQPVVAVFAVAGLLAFATSLGFSGFMGFSIVALAMLKLMNIPSFQKGFQEYDIVTQLSPTYGYVYPFLELAIGLGFLSQALPVITGILAAVIGGIGCVSVFKAVYVENKDLNCACVGGDQAVPLGFISFLENAMMLAMGLFLLVASAL